MRITSFLTMAFAAFVMATPAAEPVAEASVAQVSKIMASDASPVDLVTRQVEAESKIMASDASPPNLVTRQSMSRKP